MLDRRSISCSSMLVVIDFSWYVFMCCAYLMSLEHLFCFYVDGMVLNLITFPLSYYLTCIDIHLQTIKISSLKKNGPGGCYAHVAGLDSGEFNELCYECT